VIVTARVPTLLSLMSDQNRPTGSVWLTGGAPTQQAYTPPGQGVRHAYPLAVRDHSLSTAFGLILRSLPYAVARFGVHLAFTVGCIIWLIVTFGGAAWLTAHIAQAFGLVWLVVCLVGAGWFWAMILRYVLHLIACGHVAVLTELITRGQVGNGSESMFAYGRRVVTERFGQVNALFALNALVRGVVQTFHRTLDWAADLLPIPGLESLATVLTAILRAATRYLDKVIFSYNLARNETDPWSGAREGIVYYCQNAKPILQTAIWNLIQERVLSFFLWLLLLAPAAAITVILPSSVREVGGLITVVIALLLTSALREAFIKPLFLAMIAIRFHALVENQPINAEWADRLSGMSDRFRSFAENARTVRP
jgi:hypothetical protein